MLMFNLTTHPAVLRSWKTPNQTDKKVQHHKCVNVKEVKGLGCKHAATALVFLATT